jgi:TrmH family RNA methyltransferase
MNLISSRSNSTVKLARALRQKKARLESGLFLVEGIRPVGEAVEAKAEIETIFYAPDVLHSEFAEELIRSQAKQGVTCLPVTTDVFDSISDKENPQGILALVKQNPKKLEELNPENFPWGVGLVAPQDPGNLGTILRTIDAVGASGLLLLDSNLDVYHPSAVRASMGSLFWYPVVTASFRDFIQWSRMHGYTVYGTSAHAHLDYRRLQQYASPRVLLMGSERQGLTEEQSAACDALISMPMRGRATSLNLAIAAGVMLYAMLDR